MHKAEGVLFPDALVHAADACGLKVLRVPEKTLEVGAQKVLAAPASKLSGEIAALSPR